MKYLISLLLGLVCSSCGYHGVTYSVDNESSQKITKFDVRQKSGKPVFSARNISPPYSTANSSDAPIGFNLYKFYTVYCSLEDGSSFKISVDCRNLPRSNDKEYSSLRFYVRNDSLSLTQDWKTPVKDRVFHKVHFKK